MSLPHSIQNNPNAFLLKPIWRGVHEKAKMFNMVTCGKRGSGKSWTIISLADILDRTKTDVPRFSIERVAFSPLQLADLLHRDFPIGTVIILDEAGLALFNRDAMTTAVKEITKLLQTIRYKQYILLFCLPDFKMLDSGARKLMDVYSEMVGIDFVKKQGILKWHWVDVNPNTGVIYRFRPIRIEKILHPSGLTFNKKIFINSIRVDKPRQELIDEYEKRKKEFLDAHSLNVKNRLQSLEPKVEKKLSLKEGLEYVRANIEKFLNDKKFINREKIIATDMMSKNVATQIQRLINVELTKQRQNNASS